MRFSLACTFAAVALGRSASATLHPPGDQAPLLHPSDDGGHVSPALFAELEELSRVVDVSYCVGMTSRGVYKPFQCLSRCSDFPDFELVTTWNTGPLLSDSCGYIALDHGKQRVIAAFRGTYSVANTIADLSTIPQEYVPYPGGDDDDDGASSASDLGKKIADGLGSRWKRDAVEPGEPKCTNCTVHMGFHRAWLHTRDAILDDLQDQLVLHPHYQLNLVGHSLGGAVAALAGLDLLARGWDPLVTTFGEPRIGNAALVEYLDARFDLSSASDHHDSTAKHLRYRRVTHVDDPVPLLPLSEWGYAMHAGEIYISKPSLSPDVVDLRLCTGDNDPTCIAGQDATVVPDTNNPSRRRRDLVASVRDEIHDVATEPWGIPSRYKLWQLFFAHRDYFWRIGLCVPGGDPLGGGRKYEHVRDDARDDS